MIITGLNLLKHGALTVSSAHSSGLYNKEKMLDGDAKTLWHTSGPGKHFARFDFHSPYSISKVVITRRQGKAYIDENSFYLLA